MKKEKTELPLSTLRISVADMVTLRVRASGPGNPAPEFLYQGLPARAMALMATIPRGTFAVSISASAYPVVKSPPAGDGFAIVYARQPDRGYEAVSVLLQGRTLGIEEFHGMACRQVEDHEGRLKSIRGRYGYFAPTREEWDVILRDSGYTTLDPSEIPADITSELLQRRAGPLNNGIIARIPVHGGSKGSPAALIPVFARVDLTLDSNPGRQSPWVSFATYQKERDLRSHPPVSIAGDFREWQKLLASESGFENFVFRPGMFFGDSIEWWGSRNLRRTEHEGIDFAEGFRTGTGVRNIAEGTPVRAITDGEVVAILDDFLDKTVAVRHPEIMLKNGDIFFTLLSHIRPAAGLSGPVVKGQLLGRVAKAKSAGAPAHLHLTGAWIPRSIHEIKLDHINPAFAPVALVNFNQWLTNQ